MLTDNQLLGADPIPESTLHPCIQINIRQTYDELAAAIAPAVAGKGLYRHDDYYCTLEPANTPTGYRFTPMPAERFCTWLAYANCCRFFSPARNAEDPPTATSLSPAQASIILHSDILRQAVPEITAVSPVRLPLITYKNGRATLQPSKIGYDPATKIYTIDSIPINWEKSQAWPLHQCVKGLCTLFKDFPLDGGEIPLQQSRSMGAVVTAMLGQFLHHSQKLSPLIVANANQPGTGKTFLTQAMLAPFFGEVAPGNYTEDDNEMRKTLNSALFNGAPFFFLDDLKTIGGRVLPRFVTAPFIQDRELGTNRMFEKPQRMQFFITGNSLKTSADIERRALPIDLFWAGDATTRTQFTALKAEHFASPHWRREVLSALWGLCVHWERQGSPTLGDVPALNSFKEYVATAAAIAVCAGFASPFGPRMVNLDTGDTMKSALLELLTYVADGILPPQDDPYRPHTGLTTTYRVAELVDIAREQDLLDIITNSAKDPGAVLGRLMRSLKGREFTDSHGRRYRLGDRTRSARTSYPFLILSEPTRSLEEDTEISTPFD